jgi:glycosyltransferase involved in cell wall biosynthesis
LKDYQYDVLILGNICDLGAMLNISLSKKGLRCKLALRGRAVEKLDTSARQNLGQDVVYYRNVVQFIRLARKSRLLVSITGALIGALKTLWPVRSLLSLPPLVNISTGSDITELAIAKNLPGRIYRSYLKFADLNWCAAYPESIKNIVSLRVPSVVFMRFPYFLEDREPHTPVDPNRRFRFFHPSNLDWKVQDRSRNRNSSKGNDRFFRAFARAVKSGLEAECVILDRGPDRAIAKELINELGVADKFIWKTPLSRQDLFAEYAQADVVVDQFDVGGSGGITIEAMSAGKPVMIYLQEDCLRLLYPEPMPVLNCRSEEEIYAAIMKCRDREYLQRLGREAKAWVFKYHYWETCLDQFLFYYNLLTGHNVVDYGAS